MYDDDLTALEDWLRRLKLEYDIFFNGNRKKPPDDLRMKLERLLKKLGEAGDMSFQERFRYNTIVARYYIYKDLWRRTLLNREGGVGGSFRTHEKPEIAPDASTQPCTRECHVSIGDPETEPDRIKELYEGLLSLKSGAPADLTSIPFDRFAKYISDQTRDLRAKYDCSRVIFTVARENDTVRFKARPESSRGPASA